MDRALTILSTFQVGRSKQTLAELAVSTGFYKSTILRLASSLEAFGYLHRDDSGAFVVGPEPLRLAAIYHRSSTLESKVRPVLRSLVEQTSESASLFTRYGNQRQCLYREETPRSIRDHVMEGDTLPLGIGAGGRVLTNFSVERMKDAEFVNRFAELPYATFGERDPETAAMSAPVFNQYHLLGALTISGPRTRLTPERVAEIAPVLMSKADALSKLLGWPGLHVDA